MNTQPASAQGDLEKGGDRLVWVLNRDLNPYTEEFRGLKITIPGENQKIYKHVRDGGNLMEFLSARRFLGQPKAPSLTAVDGTVVNGPKALHTVELKEEEMEKFYGKSSEAVKKDISKLENKKRFICALDGKEFQSQKALNAYMKKTYPGAEILSVEI